MSTLATEMSPFLCAITFSSLGSKALHGPHHLEQSRLKNPCNAKQKDGLYSSQQGNLVLFEVIFVGHDFANLYSTYVAKKSTITGSLLFSTLSTKSLSSCTLKDPAAFGVVANARLHTDVKLLVTFLLIKPFILRLKLISNYVNFSRK